MKVINLFGGPGAGKSTTAAGLFYVMKLEGARVELVTEVAKPLAYQKHYNVLEDQLYILGEQNRRLEILKGQVDWVVTDSPILFSLVYQPVEYYSAFAPFVQEIWDSYDNYSFLLDRGSVPYKQYGRSQTEGEARQKDNEIHDLLNSYSVDYTMIRGEANLRVNTILTELQRGPYTFST